MYAYMRVGFGIFGRDEMRTISSAVIQQHGIHFSLCFSECLLKLAGKNNMYQFEYDMHGWKHTHTHADSTTDSVSFRLEMNL